ncbi:sugar phosphate isomerase/epimerase family protein [Paenibacillus aquistagni]|uniref:Sugar phosphate isomerase/epimerase n=1 Tax=Paenibacillus aquistagni TaxID=1852522 RepID=A0A1X7LR76_9BACL|nr:sugar phosphate isomerase/epimerase [Paenibacillus aquistagni]SMG56381.1 Sugar phosphate isomerase/epimerase [Paenibacillus aquistagni]
MRIGLQLYTVRDEMEKDFVGTLEKVAAMGYEGVEFAGYGGLTPAELSSTLKRLNLKAVGSHIGLDQLMNHLDEQVDMNKAIGNEYLVCPWIAKEQYETKEALAKTVSLLTDAAARVQQHGMKIGYHNHAFELEHEVDGKTVLEQIFELAPQVVTELDVCWVQYSGHDPLAWIERYQGRLPFVHFKDLAIAEDGSPVTMELGKGTLDLVSVAQTAKAAGAEWLIVEQDFTQRGSLESVEASLQWIKDNLKDL